MASPTNDRWAGGRAYDAFMGRWSRRMAPRFLDWLDLPPGLRWLDVGAGTGALSETILARCAPASLVGVEPSADFVGHARAAIPDPRAAFRVGTAQETGLPDRSVEVAVAGLVLNFVPDPVAAIREAGRVVVPGGVVGAYVWDYAEGMALLRHFWDAVIALEPGSPAADEGGRFPIAAPGPLASTFRTAGLMAVETTALEIPMVFANFDDYWQPLLGGAGPAGAYTASLAPRGREALRERLRSTLPTAADGSVRLSARAWGVRGQVALGA